MPHPITPELERFIAERIDSQVAAQMARFQAEYLDELLKVPEVMKILKSSKRYVYKLKDAGRIPYINISCNGGREMLRFKRGDILIFLKSNHHGTKK